MGLFSFASDIIGGLWSDKQSRKSEKRQLSEARYQFEQQRLPQVVKDARQAGLHPLFALGGSAGASPTVTAGQPSTGSHAGDAIARAGERYARSQGDKLAAELLRAQIAGEKSRTKGQEIENMAAASELARTTQRATMGSARTIPVPEGERSTFIPVGRQAPGLAHRETESFAKQSHPKHIEMVGEHGRRKTLNPDLGLDELAQVLYGADILGELISSHVREQYDKWHRFHGGRGRIWRSKK